MQHKPSQPLHKLLCWQRQGEEDIALRGVDTKKTRTVRWGRIFEDIFVAEAKKAELEGRLLEDSKAAACPRAALPSSPGSERRAPATRLHAGARQPGGETPCLTHQVAKDSGSHHHTTATAAVATSISTFPRLKRDLPVAAALSSAQFTNPRSTQI